MSSKLLIEINDLSQANEFIEKQYGAILINMAGLSSSKMFDCYTNEISLISVKAKENNVELFINLNSLYDESDLISLRPILKRLAKLNIKNIVVQDFGVIKVAEELGLDFNYFNGDAILNTNYASIMAFEEYFEGFYLSNEININEIKKIASEVDKKLFIQVYGKQRIFKSKRKLLTAYYDYIESDSQLKSIYDYLLISDENEEENFSYIYEDELGTYIYTQKSVNGLNYLKELKEMKISYFYLDNIYVDKDKYENIVKIFYEYLNEKISLEQAQKLLEKEDQELSTSFFEDKTIFTLEQIKELESREE